MKWIKKKVFHLLSSCQISSLSTPSHSSPPFLFLVLYRSKSHVANQHIYVRLRGMESTTTKSLTELQSCVSNNKEWEQNTWLGSKSLSIYTSGAGRMASTSFQDPTQMSGMRGTRTSLSPGAHGPGTLQGWHHQKLPSRATLSLWHHCKSQGKDWPCTDSRKTFSPKGTCMENKGICGRWQEYVFRPLEIQLHWEHPESTESQSKVGWCAMVQPFSRNTKNYPGE